MNDKERGLVVQTAKFIAEQLKFGRTLNFYMNHHLCIKGVEISFLKVYRACQHTRKK